MSNKNCFENLFPLGLGTTRLPVKGKSDMIGFENSVQLVLRALKSGVNYIDVGHTYSNGMALSILKEAFHYTDFRFSITAKVMLGEDQTADDTRRRFEFYLKALGLDRISHFTCWAVPSYAAFRRIMEKNGIYEGALQLRQERLIDHICCSLHAPVADMIRIIESGAFEGVTLSYSLVNAVDMQPVLDAAYRCGVGVAVMNPLAGGIIPQNQERFSFACVDAEREGTVQAALRFVRAHPAVKLILSGISSEAELEDNLAAITSPGPEEPAARFMRVLSNAPQMKDFCTGCKYCEVCPQGIPTSGILRARNALLFEPMPSYNRTGPKDLLYDLQIFRTLYMNSGWLPNTAENPCIKCGKCEIHCTQKLKIMDAVADTYHRAEKRGYSIEAHKERLNDLLCGKGYNRVGLYPSSSFAGMLIDLYNGWFGAPDFEWLLFNSDPKMWGHTSGGRTIHAPSEIVSLHPDIILICSYRHMREIEETLCQVEHEKIQVKALYDETELPWLF